MKYHYSGRCFAHRVSRRRQPAGNGLDGHRRRKPTGAIMAYPISDVSPARGDVWTRDIGQMGSLAGAAYLLQSNAGVLRHAP